MKTDMQLQSDVLAELQWEPAIHASTIGVEVKDGVVTLAGRVGSYPEKWEAEKAAQRVYGVRALAVDLEVEVTGPDAHTHTDAAIALVSAQVLKWTLLDREAAVKLLVEDGWIELTGELEWNFQRKALEEALRHVAGVKGINNYVTLRTKVSTSAVRSDIEAALNRRAANQAHRIAVDVQGSEVTLSGYVDSWAARGVAQHAAWGTAGVRSVIDNTIVAS